MQHLALLLVVAVTACDRTFDLDRIELPEPDAMFESGLVAWYKMDGLDGMRLVDETGRHHGLCSSVSCPTGMPGRIGQALQFDGASADGDIVRVVSAPDLETTAGFTIALFIWIDAFGSAYGCPINKTHGTASFNSWQLCISPSGFTAFNSYDGTTDDFKNASSMVGLKSWRHYAMVWDGTTKVLYIDGSSAINSTVAIVFDKGEIALGGDIDSANPGSFFAGMIDDIRIYNRALSVSELLVLASQ